MAAGAWIPAGPDVLIARDRSAFAVLDAVHGGLGAALQAELGE
jgi:hypothetical protein